MTTVPQFGNNIPSTIEPRRPRFNVRLLIFVLAISAPFLWIIGSAVYQSMTGGISDHGSYKAVDLKALGNFPFNDAEGTPESIPAKYRALDGQRVALQGYMYAPTTAGVKGRQFQFVYSVSKCCFGGTPQVQERVFAHTEKEVPIYNDQTLADVVGTLHVRLIRDKLTNKVVSVFDLDVESAKAVEG
jgi:hypothetical protein